MAETTTISPNWLRELGHKSRFWVVPEFKVVYNSLSKNACTTLKWVMADLAREDTRGMTAGIKGYTSDEHVVHNRALFKRVLFPDELDSALAREVHPDNGWFVFAVVRDPRSRFFSAWQDKVLLQDPAYRWLRKQPWHPAIPTSAEEVAADFARFTDAAVDDPDFPLRKDTHFRNQTASLLLDSVPYSRIYPIERMSELRDELSAHVRSLGWTADIEFRRSNDTALRANAQAFPPDVRAKVEQLYRVDFDNFGQFWDFDKIAKTPDWTPAEIRETEVRATLGRRLGDMRHIAVQTQREVDKAHNQIAKLRGELAKTQRQVAVLTRAKQHASAAEARRPLARVRRLAARALIRLRAQLAKRSP